MRYFGFHLALAAIALSPHDAAAQTATPLRVFEGTTTVTAPDGTRQAVHVDVQSWDISGQSGASFEVPLRGFYVAHLLSGTISATIAASTEDRMPGSYWAVPAGATMQIKVLGEHAILETIAVSKQWLAERGSIVRRCGPVPRHG
jgi:hypothetical protein